MAGSDKQQEARPRWKACVVTWLDATSSVDGVEDACAIEHTFVETHTIGWLIKKDREGITLCTDAHPANTPNGDCVRALHSIPRVWIKDIRYLS